MHILVIILFLPCDLSKKSPLKGSFIEHNMQDAAVFIGDECREKMGHMDPVLINELIT